jgi:hypothetical protein
MLMLANEHGIEFRHIDNNGTLQVCSFGTAEEQDCTLEGTPEDIARYAGKSSLSIADRVLLTILKRIPQ